MKAPIPIEKICIPLHPCSSAVFLPKKRLNKFAISLFDLSSHERAKEAIEFGLKMRNKRFHIFVIGDDRSGRMSTTMGYLHEYVKKLPQPPDWVYVNNFQESNRPLPFKMPSGQGAYLQSKTHELLQNASTILGKIFSSSQFRKQMDSLSHYQQSQIDQQTQDLQSQARAKGFELISGIDGLSLELQDTEEENPGEEKSPKDLVSLRNALARLSIAANIANQRIEKQIAQLKQSTARKVLTPLFQVYKEEFSTYLKGWIDEFKRDLLQNLSLLFDEENPKAKLNKAAVERYGINVLIDHSKKPGAQAVLEPKPTYENLFGSIKYRNNPSTGSIETNFNLIRPGALHRANGGILVLRADEIAKDEDAWAMLKSALRDSKITIRERYREGGTPLDDAPSPRSIPLNLQVFLVASPAWYYSFFLQDPDFPSYFKIRAEIDSDLPATSDNITHYQKLIRSTCLRETGRDITSAAISYLTGYSSRWARDREKLSAKFELIGDILAEADAIASETSKKKPIDENVIDQVFLQRRRRNARLEDGTLEDIQRNQVLIDTQGKKVGLVNGLTILSISDRSFGIPARISARTYVGEEGVVNIERLTDLGGPIQQKGAFILEGFLNGVFAQKYPLSCSCSLTFEQNYSDVEGDSASMAELISILSSLANVSVRQDIAITGSINQFGSAQVVGGIHTKIEGFHRLCKERGFTKTQGVIIPNANVANLTLRPEVVEDIAAGNFQIWGVDDIYEAVELMTGIPAGIKVNDVGQIVGAFKKDSVFYKAAETLKVFHQRLKSRR